MTAARIADDTHTILDTLGLLSTLPGKADDAQAASWWQANPDYQIIRTGALWVTKVTTGLASAVGLGSVGAIVGAWNSDSGNERIAIIASATALFAAALIAIGPIIAADVRGRADSAGRQYDARGLVAAAAIAHPLTVNVSGGDGFVNALQTLVGSLRVSGPDFGPVAIEGVKRGDDRQWRLKIGDADWRRWNEITEVSAEA